MAPLVFLFVIACCGLLGAPGAALPARILQKEEALKYLLDFLPPMDADLPLAYLENNVDLALKAYRANRWSRAVPWEIFLNEVLPHAVVNEPRDNWRAMMNGLFAPLVVNAKSTNKAAKILNDEVWAIWNIVFKGSQSPYILSPKQVISAGLFLEHNPNRPANVSTYSAFASCSGVSIFLVDACRSVGIPARMTGIAQWVKPYADGGGPLGSGAFVPEGGGAFVCPPGAPASCKEADFAALAATVESGTSAATADPEFDNHNWVEVWDNGRWSFVGAIEPDPAGLNRTWFFPYPAKYSTIGSTLNGLWATSYAPTPDGTSFPMVWAWNSTAVHGVDVTESYISAKVKQ